MSGEETPQSKREEDVAKGHAQLTELLEQGRFSVLPMAENGDEDFHSTPQLRGVAQPLTPEQVESAKECLRVLQTRSKGVLSARCALGFTLFLPALFLPSYTLGWSTSGGHALAICIVALLPWLSVELNSIGCSSKEWLFEQFEQGFLPEEEVDKALGVSGARARLTACTWHVTRLMSWSGVINLLAVVQTVRVVFV